MALAAKVMTIAARLEGVAVVIRTAPYRPRQISNF